MFTLFFTVLVTLIPISEKSTGNNMAEQRVTLDSFIADQESMTIASNQAQTLIQMGAPTDVPLPAFFLPDPDQRTDQRNLRYILTLIIQYHTKTHFQDHNTIWELAEDTYLVTLSSPELVLIKCTSKQAVIYKPEQISLLKITTLDIIDQNKMIFRLGLLIAKYEDLLPCAFKVMRNEETGISFLNSVLEVRP